MQENIIFRLISGEELEEDLDKILKKNSIEKNSIIVFSICKDDNIINSGCYYKKIIFSNKENLENNNKYLLIISTFEDILSPITDILINFEVNVKIDECNYNTCRDLLLHNKILNYKGYNGTLSGLISEDTIKLYNIILPIFLDIYIKYFKGANENHIYNIFIRYFINKQFYSNIEKYSIKSNKEFIIKSMFLKIITHEYITINKNDYKLYNHFLENIYDDEYIEHDDYYYGWLVLV